MRITRKTKQFGIFIVDLILLYSAIWVSLALRVASVPSLARVWAHCGRVFTGDADMDRHLLHDGALCA